MKDIFKKNRIEDPIDQEINIMKQEILDEEDPKKVNEKLDLLEKLVARRKEELGLDKEKHSVRIGNIFGPINPNTLIQGFFSIVSIAMILEYEKTDIISSKSMSIAQRMLGK